MTKKDHLAEKFPISDASVDEAHILDSSDMTNPSIVHLGLSPLNFQKNQ